MFQTSDNFYGLARRGPCLSCADNSRTGQNIPGGVSGKQSKGGESLFPTALGLVELHEAHTAPPTPLRGRHPRRPDRLVTTRPGRAAGLWGQGRSARPSSRADRREPTGKPFTCPSGQWRGAVIPLPPPSAVATATSRPGSGAVPGRAGSSPRPQPRLRPASLCRPPKHRVALRVAVPHRGAARSASAAAAIGGSARPRPAVGLPASVLAPPPLYSASSLGLPVSPPSSLPLRSCVRVPPAARGASPPPGMAPLTAPVRA